MPLRSYGNPSSAVDIYSLGNNIVLVHLLFSLLIVSKSYINQYRFQMTTFFSSLVVGSPIPGEALIILIVLSSLYFFLCSIVPIYQVISPAFNMVRMVQNFRGSNKQLYTFISIHQQCTDVF